MRDYEQRHTFYLAISYENKSIANHIAKYLMHNNKYLWPTFPWWMYSSEEDKYIKNLGAVGDLEILGAGNADTFIWIYPVRKGGWCELGAACYRLANEGDIDILMFLPKAEVDNYLPPFCYQDGVNIFYVEDKIFKDLNQLANFVHVTLNRENQ